MTIRNLEAVFKPSSVAVVGASEREGSIGRVVLNNLLAAGFGGPVYPVNPKYDRLAGLPVYADVGRLPVAPDLAVISTPAATVPGIVAALGKRGTRGVVVISAGFTETQTAAGRALERRMLRQARPHLLRVIGPNCLGVLSPGIGLNASFAHLRPLPGRLAFAAQSGAILTSLLDWAASRGIGFSHLVSLGGMADVDFGDMLDYLALDRGTDAILLYIEGVTQARKFMSAARAAARLKPVIVVKAGRFAAGARAAASHTGALAGSDAVYDAAFRRAGLLRVLTLTELFEAAEILAMTRGAPGERLAIVSNGGGMGVIATDSLAEQGGRLAELSPATIAKLDRMLPKTWSRANPVDLIGDATGERYKAALAVLDGDPGVDAVLAIHCPTAVASSLEAAEEMAAAAAEPHRPLLLTSWVGEETAAEARRYLAAKRIPSYATPERAVRAFMHLVEYRRSQAALMETPSALPGDFTPDRAAVRRIVLRALDSGRDWLHEIEAKRVLAAYGIPVVPTRIARNPAEAAAIADVLTVTGPVALKIVSPDIVHKSDVGGVALDLGDAAAVLKEAEAMAGRILEALPGAVVEGFAVEPMVRLDDAYELLIGATVDPLFGPVILFGHGGVAAEVIADTALGLLPLNLKLAYEIMARTRVYRQLGGFRHRRAADLDGIALVLVRVAQLAAETAELVEMDINPLIAGPGGVMAADARMRVAAASGEAAARLAICPYPAELSLTIECGGRKMLLRPIRPEDEARLQAFFARLTPEELRLRFMVPRRVFSHAEAARFTQIDYDRDMVLILVEHGGRGEIAGMVQASLDPDYERAEFGIIVRSDLTGRGLGTRMLAHLCAYLKARGAREVFGEVLAENTAMLSFASRFGLQTSPIPGDRTVVRLSLAL